MWEGKLRAYFRISTESMHFNHMHLYTSGPLTVTRGVLYLKLCGAIPHSSRVSHFPSVSVNSDLVGVSRSVMSVSLQPHGLGLARLFCPWDYPGKNTGAGFHFLLQVVQASRALYGKKN